jgi:uroporphyrinogen-III synthase
VATTPIVTTPPSDVADRIAALEARGTTPDPDAVRKEVDARIAALATPRENGESAGALGAAVGTQAQQVAALSARVATLETALGNSARLDDLAKRLQTLESKSADAASVLALSDRVHALETSARTAVAEQTARVGLLLAIAQWHEAIAFGRPYQLELESVKVLSARAGAPITIDDPGIIAHATTGIATIDTLRARFDDNAGRVLRATAVPDGVGGWLARSFERLFAIITIRRVDGLVQGNMPSAILARAGAYLRDGNLAAALTEMDALQGPAAEAAQPWVDEARARVAAERAAGDATAKAVATLGASNTTDSAGAAAEKPAPEQ